MKRNFIKSSAVVATLLVAFSTPDALAYNPFGETPTLPCTVTEASLEDEYGCKVFAGRGNTTGMIGEMGKIREGAMAMARNEVKKKIISYALMQTKRYNSRIEDDATSKYSVKDILDEDSLDLYLQTVGEYCIRYFDEDYTDMCTCYLSIVIPIEELIDYGVIKNF